MRELHPACLFLACPGCVLYLLGQVLTYVPCPWSALVARVSLEVWGRVL